MELNEKFQYKFKSNGEIVEDIFVKRSAGTTYYLAVGVKGKEERFNPKHMHEHLEEYENNINNNIIKLIESGYKFTSFVGTTTDGNSVLVRVEDDCL